MKSEFGRFGGFVRCLIYYCNFESELRLLCMFNLRVAFVIFVHGQLWKDCESMIHMCNFESDVKIFVHVQLCQWIVSDIHGGGAYIVQCIYLHMLNVCVRHVSLYVCRDHARGDNMHSNCAHRQVAMFVTKSLSIVFVVVQHMNIYQKKKKKHEIICQCNTWPSYLRYYAHFVNVKNSLLQIKVYSTRYTVYNRSGTLAPALFRHLRSSLISAPGRSRNFIQPAGHSFVLNKFRYL